MREKKLCFIIGFLVSAVLYTAIIIAVNLISYANQPTQTVNLDAYQSLGSMRSSFVWSKDPSFFECAFGALVVDGPCENPRSIKVELNMADPAIHNGVNRILRELLVNVFPGKADTTPGQFWQRVDAQFQTDPYLPQVFKGSGLGLGRYLTVEWVPVIGQMWITVDSEAAYYARAKKNNQRISP